MNNTEKTIKNITSHQSNDDTSQQSHSFTGSYKCANCNNDIYFNSVNGHSKTCKFNLINEFSDDKSNMTFTLNNNENTFSTLKKVYDNEDFDVNIEKKAINHKNIDQFFILADKIYQKVINKIEKSNFKIKDLSNNKITEINNYFVAITPNIKEKLSSKQEHIFHDRIVIFEDVYHNTPVFRLSFHSLKNEDFQIKFKVYSNTQHPEIKKLYNQLLLIPSKYKKKVNNNSGHYTLGKSIFIRGIIKENTYNLYFTDIKDLWICDADNKYDNILDIKNDS
jgi:hypothetical protein